MPGLNVGFFCVFLLYLYFASLDGCAACRIVFIHLDGKPSIVERVLCGMRVPSE